MSVYLDLNFFQYSQYSVRCQEAFADHQRRHGWIVHPTLNNVDVELNQPNVLVQNYPLRHLVIYN